MKTRFLIPLVVIALGGCGRQSNQPQSTAASPAVSPQPPAAVKSAKVTWSDFSVPPEPAATPELVAHGKTVYEQNCAACHGEHGQAQGKCSAFLLPRPRNFTQAHFRLRSTPSGNLPTDADLFRTVSLGVNGTPMPPWKFHLSEQDRWAAIAYIKTFSRRFADAEEDRTTLVDIGAPPVRSEQAISAGKALYTKMGCFKCHGESGHGDGPSSHTLTDDSGLRIHARDFTNPNGFKRGYATEEIVRTFLTGLDGTPMPSFQEAMSKEQAWELAYYIETLVKPSVTPVVRKSQNFLVHEELGEPDVRIKLTERAWDYDPKEIRVKKGQVVEVTFEPTDNGLGAGHGFAVSSYDEVAFINGAMVGAPKTVKFRADRAGKFTFYCATQCSTDKLHPLMNGTFVVEDTEAAKTASIQ